MGEQTSLIPLREAKLDAIGFSWLVARGSNTNDASHVEDVVSTTAVPPKETIRGSFRDRLFVAN